MIRGDGGTNGGTSSRGRPLNLPKISDAEWEKHALVAAASRDPIPHDPTLLRAIVRALLTRIDKKAPREAAWIKGIVQELAAMEYDALLAQASDEEKTGIHDGFLELIQSSGPGWRTHDAEIVKVQRRVLVIFVSLNPYPTGPSERWGWIVKHGGEIMKLIAGLPCLCRYERDWKGLKDGVPIKGKGRKAARLEPGHCRTPGEIIDLLLAYVHNTTPQNIQKLLRPKHT